MSFLSEILLKENKNASTIKNALYAFQAMPKELLLEQIPSVILRARNETTNLVTHGDPAGTIENYLNNIGYLVKATNLDIKMSLGQYGLYEINLEGEIYNLNNVDNDMLSKLFVIGRSYDLYFGWSNNISYNKAKFNPFAMWIPCKLATVKINRIDYKRYSFKSQFYNDMQSTESELDYRFLGIVLDSNEIAVHETLFKSSTRRVGKPLTVPKAIAGETKSFTTVRVLCDLLSSKLKYIKNKDDEDKIYLFKEIEFQFGDILNVDPAYFSYGYTIKSLGTTPKVLSNNSIGFLKIYFDQIQMNPFAGNLKAVLSNLLNLLPDEIRTRITYYINETEDKTIIIFYDTKEFEDTGSDNDGTGITFTMNQKNSIIKEITFNYEQPLYSLALLRTFKDGKIEYSNAEKNEQIAENICKRMGINFSRLKELASKAGITREFSNYVDIIASYKAKEQQQTDGKSTENRSNNTTNNNASQIKASAEKIGNALVQFFGVKCDMTIRGFCGIYPAQKVKIKGDALFDGDYLVNELHHKIKPDGFDTELNLLLIAPSDRMGIILGSKK